MTNPRLNNQDVDVEELETEFGHEMFEPELIGDDIEDAAQDVQTLQLLWVVELCKGLTIEPTVTLVEIGD